MVIHLKGVICASRYQLTPTIDYAARFVIKIDKHFRIILLQQSTEYLNILVGP